MEACEAQRPGRFTGETAMTMTEREVIKAEVGLLVNRLGNGVHPHIQW